MCVPTAYRAVRAAVVMSGLAAIACGANAAQKVVASAQVPTIEGITSTPIVLDVPFETDEPVSGVGLTGLFRATVFDDIDGQFPWSLDANVVVEAPAGPSREQAGPELVWDYIGGDVSFADYPFQDFTDGFPGVPGTGVFRWSFFSAVTLGEFEIVGPTLHLMTSVAPAEVAYDATTATGQFWDRPFFIAGISNGGPVQYDVLELEVDTSGGYTFTSVVQAPPDDPTPNFTFLYRGSFDPARPLENLLDYGLGNGNAPNGSPFGESFISALLFEGETYFYVTSQWSRFDVAHPFETDIVGPGRLRTVSAELCYGDINRDGATNLDDFTALAIAFGQTGEPNEGADLTGDGVVDLDDFSVLAVDFGCGVPAE